MPRVDRRVYSSWTMDLRRPGGNSVAGHTGAQGPARFSYVSGRGFAGGGQSERLSTVQHGDGNRASSRWSTDRPLEEGQHRRGGNRRRLYACSATKAGEAGNAVTPQDTRHRQPQVRDQRAGDIRDADWN